VEVCFGPHVRAWYLWCQLDKCSGDVFLECVGKKYEDFLFVCTTRQYVVFQASQKTNKSHELYLYFWFLILSHITQCKATQNKETTNEQRTTLSTIMTMRQVQLRRPFDVLVLVVVVNVLLVATTTAFAPVVTRPNYSNKYNARR
jgi:hypothetical protein